MQIISDNHTINYYSTASAQPNNKFRQNPWNLQGFRGKSCILH